MTDQVEVTVKPKEVKPRKTAKATAKPVELAKANAGISIFTRVGDSNPWTSDDIDRMESVDLEEYRKVVEACRFFYKRDPLASTVINKMVDIGINDIEFSKNGISENEYRVYEALEDKFKEFAENMALEFLLSGLVIPEIKFAPVGRDDLKMLGIKRYETLKLPVSMWVRDPSSIVINKTILSEKPTYYLEIPDDLIYFIQHKGKYPDGTQDIKLYLQLQALYPAFFTAVENGEKRIQIDSPLAIRRRATSDSPYPIPYLYPAIEPLKHKRNLRRMDYSIASRVISAIQLVKLGSDEFPLTEDNSDQLEDIKGQMLWRNGTGKDVERIFQLFSNHTLDISWVTPPVEAMLNDAKYRDINQDIIFALGFPRILITGETEKSNTSDAQFASISPVKTMDNFRKKLEVILQQVVNEIAKQNNFKNVPEVYFEPLQLIEFKTYIEAIANLYATGNLSRGTFAEKLGFSWKDEMEDKIEEQDILENSGLPEFAPQAFSPQPGDNNQESVPAKPTQNKPKAEKPQQT